MQKQILKNDWADLLAEEFEKEYYIALREFLKGEYNNHNVYPQMDDIFNALHLTPFKDVKVVILGQDPYHGPNQAQGLSFSVQKGVKVPPSLKNIFQELENDIGCPKPDHGDLTKWTRQGVLLLNSVLTVREGQPHSHQNKGWEIFTNRVIEVLNKKEAPIVYILWGRAAQKKEELINVEKHSVIRSPHPSPFSARRGFFGSKPFSKTNQYLRKSKQTEVDWCLD
ncbi:uracil-DNA glycosylase [Virgibacillus halodenitrificans]|uniref:Uracil-DNA glycosylase n=1 Tax=Virgibacillus halodenitrificans TaxID=1482 RepID=A0ABR7VT37_VIRHA|nr:uracil-DNA glycosylase [Virgibacillus halodenitrificans]MBD1224783.1 uracil-DNA glycosylase [Virgibacillus halodenitrificans]MYL47532.1 uracil-DNA glycosylase [Virgibacillus halodenitrificans]